MSNKLSMRVTEFAGAGGGAYLIPDDRRALQARTALNFLLAVITSLFGLFIIALFIRSQYTDWESLSAPWQPLANPWQLWLNTFLLFVSSGAFHWARIASRRNNANGTIEGLLVAGLFATLFIAGQLWLWQQLAIQGYGVAGNPANSFFYLLTGMHGAHLLGGMIAWARTTIKAWRGDSPDSIKNSVALCTRYWHYLLGLWMVLFVLLISKPETFAAIAAFCGF